MLSLLSLNEMLSACLHVHGRKVVEGTATLAAIEKEDTVNQRPVTPVTITNCGVSQFVF